MNLLDFNLLLSDPSKVEKDPALRTQYGIIDMRHDGWRW